MDPATMILLFLGGALALGGSGKKSSSDLKSQWEAKTKEERLFWLEEIRSMSKWYSDRFDSMPQLDDYFTVVGYIESRFNPASINKSPTSNPDNSARGLFHMRPETAFKPANGLEHLRRQPNLLLNPKWAFVTALFGVWQACDSADSKGSGDPDWASVRRWWMKPIRVHDFAYEYEESTTNTNRFLEGIEGCNENYGTNVNPDFIWYRVRGWRNYPGIEETLRIYGLKSGSHS